MDIIFFQILLELGLTWSGNPTLKFHLTSALSGFQTVDIKVEHFQLFGTMRVGIKPLTATAPVLGNLHLSLIGRPAMDFSLSVAGGALDVMGVPGLSSFLHNFLRNTVTSLMVYPKIVEASPTETNPQTPQRALDARSSLSWMVGFVRKGVAVSASVGRNLILGGRWRER